MAQILEVIDIANAPQFRVHVYNVPINDNNTNPQFKKCWQDAVGHEEGKAPRELQGRQSVCPAVGGHIKGPVWVYDFLIEKGDILQRQVKLTDHRLQPQDLKLVTATVEKERQEAKRKKKASARGNPFTCQQRQVPTSALLAPTGRRDSYVRERNNQIAGGNRNEAAAGAENTIYVRSKTRSHRHTTTRVQLKK